MRVWDTVAGGDVCLVTRRATVNLGQFTSIAPNVNTLLSLGKQL